MASSPPFLKYFAKQVRGGLPAPAAQTQGRGGVIGPALKKDTIEHD